MRAWRANRRAALAEEETEKLRKKQEQERDDADAASWADRGAIHVRASGHAKEVTGDMHADIRLSVDNWSDNTIYDVILILERPHSIGTESADLAKGIVARWDAIVAQDSEHFTHKMAYIGPGDSTPKVTTIFSDHYGNRWRLTPDGSLLMGKRRRLGVDDAPFEESSP